MKHNFPHLFKLRRGGDPSGIVHSFNFYNITAFDQKQCFASFPPAGKINSAGSRATHSELRFCSRGVHCLLAAWESILISKIADAVILYALKSRCRREESRRTHGIYFFSEEGAEICAQISPKSSQRKIYRRPRQRTKQPLTRSAARIAPQDAIRMASSRRFASS